MIVSAKTEYACIAVLELAARHGGDPVRIRDIAAAHGIPARFLVQILLQLKTAGIVASTRGASGGYKLSRDPEKITLGEVMSVADTQWGQPPALAGAGNPTQAVLSAVWRRAAERERELLAGVSLADLVRKLRSPAEAMYYI